MVLFVEKFVAVVVVERCKQFDLGRVVEWMSVDDDLLQLYELLRVVMQLLVVRERDDAIVVVAVVVHMGNGWRSLLKFCDWSQNLLLIRKYMLSRRFLGLQEFRQLLPDDVLVLDRDGHCLKILNDF